MRRVRAAIASLLLSLQLAGCYHYVPARTTHLPSGTRVALRLTDQGRVALTDALGPGVRRIEGHLESSSDTALVLSVAAVEHLDLPVPVKWRGDRVSVSRSLVSDVEEWRIAKGRSWLMAGLLVAGAVVASTIAIRGFGADPSEDGRGNGEPGQDAVVPRIQGKSTIYWWNVYEKR